MVSLGSITNYLTWALGNKEILDLKIQKLNGHWNEGYALDLHTSSSKPIREIGKKIEIIDGKETESFHEIILGWDTKYTEIGEHMNKLKYWHERNRLPIIANEAAKFLNDKTEWEIDFMIPVPPSDTTRKWQPVEELAKAIGAIRKLTVDLWTLKKLKSTSQLKDVKDADRRREILKGAFDIFSNSLDGKNVLLFDDLFRSGETLNAVYDIVKNKGNAKKVYVLTITRTRSKK